MPDTLRPYTVSALVNTETGELLGTPVVRPGHEDYHGFDSVKPPGATEQFRWVHVRAPNEAAAAATNALTADLRPGADRSAPQARTLTGDAGLKPYSVAAVVHTRTGRPIGTPVAAGGHHNLAGATFVGRRGRHSHTANVWARDAADAVDQVFGTNPATANAAGRRSVAAARGDPPGPGQVITLHAVALAQREWSRLATVPQAARAALVADTVWNREYPPTYRTAYTAAAARIAAAATEAAAANPGAWTTLHQLAAAAGDALSRLAPDHPSPPPADQSTVAAAQRAAAPPGQPPWQRVAAVAAAGSSTAGTLAGTLTATADVLAGWRARSGQVLAEGIAVGGKPANVWVADLLAAVNREIATPVAAAPTAVRTAAQLAGEDRAPKVSAMTAGTASRRTRPARSSAPASTTTRRTR